MPVPVVYISIHFIELDLYFAQLRKIVLRSCSIWVQDLFLLFKNPVSS